MRLAAPLLATLLLGLGPPATRAGAELAPTRRVLADFAKEAVALADYSQDADVTAELIDVGAGADAAAYQGKDVRVVRLRAR